MSRCRVGDGLLFAKIGDKKISGSQSAGYRMNHFVEKDSFSSFLDNELNNVIIHTCFYFVSGNPG